MKTVQAIAFLVYILTSGCLVNKNAAPAVNTSADSTQQWINNHKQAVNISNYQSFVRSIKTSLINMGTRKIVGLGEGTHGTSEFQIIRAYITRNLCEEKGFTIICLENSYGWCVELNKYIQTGQGNLDTLMRKYMLGMWQNAEMKAFLQWMMEYNQSHTKKLQLAGMDYSETSTSAAIIQSIAQKASCPVVDSMIKTLNVYAGFMDAAYADFNNPKPTFKWKDILDNGVKAYTTAGLIKSTLDSLKQELLTRLSGEEITALYTALYNCELAYYSIYKPVKEKEEASRDEAMAKMVRRLLQNNPASKIIVWTHNAHVARGKVFNDDSNGGGSGMYLESWFPGQYFILGTGTAAGSFSATTDRFILNTSAFKSYPLANAAAGSWEQTISKTGNENWLLDARDKNIKLPSLPLRFTGYGTSTEKDFVNTKLNKLYDGFLFIPFTHATHVQQ